MLSELPSQYAAELEEIILRANSGYSDQPIRRKVVACGDLHGNPSKAVLASIIRERPDLIAVGGDVFNSAEFSPHDDFDEHVETMSVEESRILAWFEAAMRYTNAQFEFFHGNHDEWVRRGFAKNNPAKFAKYIKDPLEELVKKLPASRAKLVRTEFSWNMPGQAPRKFAESMNMYMLGDALLSHAHFANRRANISVQKLLDWVREWDKILGIDPVLLVQFHTHKLSFSSPDGWRILVEPGMCCEPEVESYKVGQHRLNWPPGVIGACVFEQELKDGNWVTDRKSFRHLYG